jgi:DNA-binding NarL/FixJ family response regulator
MAIELSSKDGSELPGAPVPVDENSSRARVALALADVLLGEALAFALCHQGFTVTTCTVCRASAHVHGRDDTVVVLDPCLDALGRARELDELRAANDNVRVVALATDICPTVARAVVQYRLDGLILRSRPLAEAIATLRAVSEGASVFPPGLTAILRDLSVRAETLTTRQRDVLDLLSAGHSNTEIAKRLHISVNTVKFHVRIIYDRLGVHSRVAAATQRSGEDGAH